MLKKKTKIKLHWELCERKIKAFIEDKVERTKLKLYWKCRVTFILKQIFLVKATLILYIFFLKLKTYSKYNWVM